MADKIGWKTQLTPDGIVSLIFVQVITCWASRLLPERVLAARLNLSFHATPLYHLMARLIACREAQRHEQKRPNPPAAKQSSPILLWKDGMPSLPLAVLLLGGKGWYRVYLLSSCVSTDIAGSQH